MAMNEKDMWLAVLLSAQPWLVGAGAFLVGYLLGAIPFGYLYGRLAGIGDIRNIGSGNIGATNVLRTGRKGLAALTLLSDAAKGFVPVLLIRQHLGMRAGLVLRGRSLSRPPLSCLASLPRRQGRRDLYWRHHGSLLACRGVLLRGLAGHRGRDPLFFALRAYCCGPHSHFRGGPCAAARFMSLCWRSPPSSSLGIIRILGT